MKLKNIKLALNLLCATPLLIVLSGCASMPADNVTQYYVSANCNNKINCFNMVQAAIDASIHTSFENWVKININSGDYYEKIVISRPKTIIQGQNEKNTRIFFDAFAQLAGHYHRNNWGTPGSATVTINAQDVKVINLKIENTYDFLANDALPADDPKKVSNSQAVTLLLDKDSDRVSVDSSSLDGFQDTLFANGKRVHIKNSQISGNIDFIFGNGAVLIENSKILSRRRSAAFNPGEYQSFIVAPSTQISDKIGIIIYKSKILHEKEVPEGSVTLGRPWHPTTKFDDGRYADPNAIGQVSFIDCFMDKHINPEHWTFMNGTARDGTKTAIFKPQDSRFSETGSFGPGATKKEIGIKWQGALSIEEIKSIFFKDWQ